MVSSRIAKAFAGIVLLVAIPAFAGDLAGFSDEQLLAMRNICAQQHGHEMIKVCDDKGMRCQPTHQRDYDDDYRDQCQSLDMEAERRVHVVLAPVPQLPGVVTNQQQPLSTVDPAATDIWLKGMMK